MEDESVRWRGGAVHIHSTDGPDKNSGGTGEKWRGANRERTERPEDHVMHSQLHTIRLVLLFAHYQLDTHAAPHTMTLG